MPEILWITIAYLCGSLPFSIWIGRLVLGKDITQVGDGNPGAANVWRAGGTRWGVAAVLLDFFKGAVPVALANLVYDIEGPWLALIAIAPIAGHAFSPFLGFRGGKALAVTFGIWAGLTLWVVPGILGTFFAISLAVLRPEGWAVLTGIFGLLIALLFMGDPLLIGVWIGMALILGWKHRHDLIHKPQLRLRRG